MNLPERIAIEALRAGVPNRTAIRLMGNEHTAVELAFEHALHAAWGEAPRAGIGIAGGFGAGKSHLLGYLAEVARGQRAVVSRIAISKETPLAQPAAVFAAALRNAELPDSAEEPLGAALAALRQDPARLQELEQEVGAPGSGFAPLFAAALFLLRRTSTPPDLARSLERMLVGGPVPLSVLRRALAEAGARGSFALARIDPRELLAKRIAFLPLLFRAAGYGPWCLLLDEVELIGRYTPLQRALSYAELAAWLGLPGTRRVRGIVSVFAVTDDFVASVSNPKQDGERLPERLRLKGRETEAMTAPAGIAAIEQAVREHRLAPPEARDLVLCHDKLARLYTEAYGWPAPDLPPPARTGSGSMRQYIKGWITQWDMLRVLGQDGGLVAETLRINYDEDPDLDAPPDAQPDAPWDVLWDGPRSGPAEEAE